MLSPWVGGWMDPAPCINDSDAACWQLFRGAFVALVYKFSMLHAAPSSTTIFCMESAS